MERDTFTDVFCVDCNGYRRQKLKGRNNYDRTLLYVCSECGCENNEKYEISDDAMQRTMKLWKL